MLFKIICQYCMVSSGQVYAVCFSDIRGTYSLWHFCNHTYWLHKFYCYETKL